MTSGVPQDHQPRTATTAATACRRNEGRPGPGPVAAGRRPSQGSLSCCQRSGTVPVPARPPAKETGQADAPEPAAPPRRCRPLRRPSQPRRARRPIDEGPYDLHPGPERGRALTLIAAPPRNQTSACPSQRGNSSAVRVFPTPGSPASSTTLPVPPRARSSRAVSVAISTSRPTKPVKKGAEVPGPGCLDSPSERGAEAEARPGSGGGASDTLWGLGRRLIASL